MEELMAQPMIMDTRVSVNSYLSWWWMTSSLSRFH